MLKSYLKVHNNQLLHNQINDTAVNLNQQLLGKISDFIKRYIYKKISVDEKYR